MIVDLHTHLWDRLEQLGADSAARVRRIAAGRWERPDGAIDAFADAMRTVDCAVILGFESDYIGASISIEQVRGYIALDPARRLGFAGIDPLKAGYLDRVREAVDAQMRGIVISPAAQAMHPAHSRAMRLYEACAERNLPVLVHPGTHLSTQSHLAFSRPHLLDEVLREVAGLRLIVAQMGHPWVDETLVLLTKYEHAYADISDLTNKPWHLYSALLLAHEQEVTDRLLFGSDFPFCTPEQAIVNLYSVNTLTKGTPLTNIPREKLRAIVERDSLALLNIAPPSTAKGAKPQPAAGGRTQGAAMDASVKESVG